jgi:hypothetical protein
MGGIVLMSKIASIAPMLVTIAGTIGGSFIGMPWLGTVLGALTAAALQAGGVGVPCRGPRVKLEDIAIRGEPP